MPQLTLSHILIGTLIATIAGAGSLLLGALPISSAANLSLQPDSGVFPLGASFEINIVAEASVPVNVFQGTLQFDHTRLQVDAISYNTALADLWAEEPWYSNGDGTINFIGGTTRSGGFSGTEILITVTFIALQEGSAHIAMPEVHILQHDGLGTPAETGKSLDAIFTIAEKTHSENKNEDTDTASKTTLHILAQNISPDLNNDGTVSLIDVSIFMRHLATQNTASDFTGDGIVTTADLAVLLNAL